MSISTKVRPASLPMTEARSLEEKSNYDDSTNTPTKLTNINGLCVRIRVVRMHNPSMINLCTHAVDNYDVQGRATKKGFDDKEPGRQYRGETNYTLPTRRPHGTQCGEYESGNWEGPRERAHGTRSNTTPRGR